MMFVVHPNYTPDIYLQFDGQDFINILANRLELSIDTRKFQIPNAQALEYDISNNTTTALNWQTSFSNLGNGEVKVNLGGSYNTNNHLIFVIGSILGNCANPVDNLEWSTFYGKSFTSADPLEAFRSSATNSDDDVYTVGTTADANYPVNNGAFTTYSGGGADATVVKFDKFAERKWATFIGGDKSDILNDVSLQSSGDIYAVGVTFSSNTFPLLNNGLAHFDNTFTCSPSHCTDNIILKFSPNGILEHSTFFNIGNHSGGTDIFEIKIDRLDKIYIAGVGDVQEVGANTSTQGWWFISEFAANLTPIWTTQFGNPVGSSQQARINGIAPDNNGQLFIYGQTESGVLGNPIAPTTSSYAASHSGSTDAFILRLNTSRQVDWRTYYGGSSTEVGGNIELDNNGNVFALGQTWSNNIPLLNEVYDTLQGWQDLFFLKFSNDGEPLWMTYYGFDSTEKAIDLAINSQNDVFFVGETYSLDFPTTGPANYHVLPFLGDYDIFITGFKSNDLQSPYWETTYGSGGRDAAYRVKISSTNKLYLTGQIFEDSYSLFNTVKPYTNSWCDDNSNTNFDTDDAFIARFNVADTVFVVDTEEQIKTVQNQFKIFPNPTTVNQINLELDEVFYNEHLLVIYDILGQIVQTVALQPFQSLYSIDVTNLNTGTYIISITGEQELSAQKLIISY